MSAMGGRLAAVYYGSAKVAGIGEWSGSGCIPDIAEATAFGDTVKTWVEVGIGDAGTITFSGNYDPADTAGQVALQALKNTGAQLTNLYFYESTSVFWRVQAGGYLVIKNFPLPKMSKNALATVTFECVISTKPMERVT